MRLERLAKSVAEATGLQHQLMLGPLRNYIKTQPEDELVKQVKDIKESRLLRILWEAGLSSGLQQAVLEQLKKIG